MKMIRQFLYPFLSLMIAVIAIESGLRLYGVKPGVYPTHRLNPYDFDSTFGWITRKNSSYLRASPEYLHYNYYNPQGFPTNYDNRDKFISKDLPKIVFIGNSMLESYYLPYEKSFPYQVNAHLNGQEVLNLGVSGYTPGQYLLQSRKYLSQFKVDQIIIFFVPFQDIGLLNNKFFPGGYAKPVFGKDLSNPINLPLVNIEMKEKKKKQIEDYSTILTVLQPLLNNWFGYINKHYKYPVKKEQLQYSPEAFLDALRYFRQIELESKPVSVTILYAPVAFEYKYSGMLAANLKNFMDACRKLQLKCVIPDFFQDQKEDGQNYFYKEDRHLNEYGSQKMANYLTLLIKDRKESKK